MGKLDQLLEKIGWAPVQEEEENETETYEEPKSAVYSSTRSAYRSSNNEIHFTSDDQENDEKFSYRPTKSVSRPQTSSYRVQPQAGPKVVNLQASVQMEVVVASPESFDEAKEISDDLRNNKPVVINLEFVEHPIAQRITDFLCGACYALGGNIQQIADKIYMIAPGNVDIAASSDFRKTLQSESGLVFPWGSEQ
ncbi:MAG: cell division protein SepF [Firmicutes bacterium]|nr:cell division protein SepF [Bacillota bacterium]